MGDELPNIASAQCRLNHYFNVLVVVLLGTGSLLANHCIGNISNGTSERIYIISLIQTPKEILQSPQYDRLI